MSTAYHPQTDGQTEIVNKSGESIGTTPYEVVYGQSPKDTVNYSKVGDWVYVKLQHYRQVTLRGNSFNKLSQKCYGPFIVLRKLGEVAYELQLPATTGIHPVFHVSQLKLHKGQVPTRVGDIPVTNQYGLLVAKPYKVLDRRLLKKGNEASVADLVQWKGGSEEDAT
ncbi:uncharacterized protein [Rutidosis leptorrhynchoides]|uniref:uncharacterized protein n=1 Tax=Rutidosis leptorrhynchoides TaxID=125765 RepID=UPI003A99377A